MIRYLIFAISYPNNFQLTMIVLAILMTITATYPLTIERSIYEELGGFGFCIVGYISVATYIHHRSADGLGMAAYRLMCVNNCYYSQTTWIVKLIVALQWVWTILIEGMNTKGILTTRNAVVFNFCCDRSIVFDSIILEYEGTFTEEGTRKADIIWQGLVGASLLGKNTFTHKFCKLHKK